MAMRTKTVLYAFDTRTTDLATNTTLGTATRHDFTKGGGAMTVHIPETGSRTFLSVRAICTFRSAWHAAPKDITGVRMGVKLGGGGFTDTDRTWTQANTGNQTYMEIDLDVTNQFNASFGVGASQTVQVGLAVSSDVADAIGGCICCHLEITYEYDDSVGTTRVKTIPIPIQSHLSGSNTAHVEIGTTGGVMDAPANQIPALATYIEEAGVTFRDAFFEMVQVNGQAGSTDFTPYIQIDATPEVAGGLVEGDLNSIMFIRCLFAYDTATHSTAAPHALKFRTDSSNAWALPGGILWVTYTYNQATSTRVMNVIDVPMMAYGAVDAGSHYTTGPTDNTEADRSHRYADFMITEPGVITMKQSAAWMLINTRSGAPAIFVKAGGHASYRQFTPPNSSGAIDVIYRGDHSGGWTLARGINRLALSMYSFSANRSITNARALVVYSSDVPAEGTEVCSRVVSFLGTSFADAGGGVLSSLVDVPGASQRVPVLNDNYSMHGAFIDLRSNSLINNLFATQFWIGVNGGEQGGENLRPIVPAANLMTPWLTAEVCTGRAYMPLHDHFRMKSTELGVKLDIETARRHVHRHGSVTVLASWVTRISMHSMSFTVSGTVTINGSAAPNGKTVEIYAVDSDGYAERVATTVTAGGAGGFTAKVPDNVRTYFASYNNDGNAGRSLVGTPT